MRLLLVDAHCGRRWRPDEDHVAAPSANAAHRFGASAITLSAPGFGNVRPLEAVPGVARVAAQIGVPFDPVPHEELPAGEVLRNLPDVFVGAVDTLAPGRCRAAAAGTLSR